MTREQAKKLLPFIKAFAEGETIECKYKSGKWVANEVFSMRFPLDCYRIAEKPKKTEVLDV